MSLGELLVKRENLLDHYFDICNVYMDATEEDPSAEFAMETDRLMLNRIEKGLGTRNQHKPVMHKNMRKDLLQIMNRVCLPEIEKRKKSKP